jgi:flagellar basal body rod protein FlgG
VKPANNLGGPTIPGARLGVVDANVSQLSPLGDTEWQVGPNLSANPPAGALRAGTGKLTPGALEASGVDETATLTRMIAAVAQYEANQRVIQVEDAELGKAVTDVGKVNA